jgi:hypothetical protein
LINEGEGEFFIKKIVELFERKIENRHLISKLEVMLEYVSLNKIKFTEEDVEKIFLSLTSLITSNQAKVKEISTKCLKKMVNILNYLSFSSEMNERMMKYLKIEKMEMVWIIWVMTTIIPSK